MRTNTISTPYGELPQEVFDALSDSERAWMKFVEKQKKE